MTALTFLLWFAFSLVLENGITSSQGTNSNERVFEYGKGETLICSIQETKSEIKSCVWSHDGSYCTAVNGQGDCPVWNNVTTEYSKKECKLTFLTVEIDHGGVYKCTLNIIEKTEEQTNSSKLTKS